MSSRTAFSAFVFLSACAPASAAVYTVGSGGTHATVQSAIAAAASNAGDDEVRIASGTIVEHVHATVVTDGRVDLSGGWNAAFDTQTADPTLTVIDGTLTGRTFLLETYGNAHVTLRNLSVVRGSADSYPNVRLSAFGLSRIELSDCESRGAVSDASTVFVAPMGAISVGALDATQIDIARCAVFDNRVDSGALVSAVGMSIGASGTAQIRVQEVSIHDNQVSADRVDGGGMIVSAGGDARVEVTESLIESNRIVELPASFSNAPGVVIATNSPGTTAQVVFRRNRVSGNTIQGASQADSSQVLVYSEGTSQVTIGDSEISNSSSSAGLDISRADNAVVNVVNATVAGNVQFDLRADGSINVSNTLAGIVTGLGDSILQNNRFGPGARYVDPAGGDYRLQPGSPALGAGTATPPGGLGPTDLDGNPRVIGFGGVDLGAYELDDPTIFRDRFED
jgi:hypothetical protein